MIALRKSPLYYLLAVLFIGLISACGARKNVPQQSLTNPNATPVDSNHYEIVIPQLLDAYFMAINDQNWDLMMDMIYPKIFDIVPKELMLQTFTGMLGTGTKVETGSPTINRLSEPIIHDGEQFVGINYSGTLKLSVLEGSELDEESVLGMMKEMYVTSYGEENVDYDQEKKMFTIKSVKSMFAIAPVDTKDWKFIENTADQPALLEQLIPETARKAMEE